MGGQDNHTTYTHACGRDNTSTKKRIAKGGGRRGNQLAYLDEIEAKAFIDRDALGIAQHGSNNVWRHVAHLPQFAHCSGGRVEVAAPAIQKHGAHQRRVRPIAHLCEKDHSQYMTDTRLPPICPCPFFFKKRCSKRHSDIVYKKRGSMGEYRVDAVGIDASAAGVRRL